MIDVDTIDLADRRGADADGEGALADAPRELLALGAVELLGVVHTADRSSVGGA